MVNMCALRCIGKENREKQFHKSEFRRERKKEREGGEIKDNKNELKCRCLKSACKSNIFLLALFS